ncbi:DUF6207 family protein [Streptomyces sp. NPDC006335]|uniref:DUF6207 family protein n=1 Tax=Streptomyces sp. NPDC006335 TaxID=3156895 RepID=UPI0033A2A25B
MAEPGLGPARGPACTGAAAENETAPAIQKLLAARCATAPADRTPWEPCMPGIRLRCSPHLRQGPTRSAAGGNQAAPVAPWTAGHRSM